MADKSFEQKTNLSPAAQEVAPYLHKIHEKMREDISDVTRKSLIELANEIVREEMEGKDVASKKVDFRLALAQIKSDLLIKEKEKKAQNIITNYVGKLDKEITS
ncbi:hypothetical protein GF366_00835 [Candidatus Peregrinibacteria bacterium]|nr:hypothetical protein [Candidatus Peregrinibacteria bacterium]